MPKIMSKLADFLAAFWCDERSQVTKLSVMTVGSVIAVLGVAVLSGIAGAQNCAKCGDSCIPCESQPCSLCPSIEPSCNQCGSCGYGTYCYGQFVCNDCEV